MMATKTLRNDVILFAPIDLAKVSQQDDGTILVPAVFSTERADDQGERVTYEALQKAAPEVRQEDDGTSVVPAGFSTERVDGQGERVTEGAVQKAGPE